MPAIFAIALLPWVILWESPVLFSTVASPTVRVGVMITLKMVMMRKRLTLLIFPSLFLLGPPLGSLAANMRRGWWAVSEVG
jgi:hypothetical protein